MNFNDILDQKWVIPTAVGVTSVLAGLGGGYFLGRKAGIEIGFEQGVDAVHEANSRDRTEDEFKLDPDDETDLEDILYDNDDDEEVDVAVTLEEGDEIVIGSKLPEEPETQTVNIFAPSLDEWDEEKEAANRVDNEPYIIHRDVFIENEKDYHQVTVTYYAGDDVLADESDTPVYNYQQTLGELKFGYGSGDNNLVYIRNDAIGREWEVIRHTGRYAVVVEGHTIEAEYEESDLRHSATSRFRSSD